MQFPIWKTVIAAMLTSVALISAPTTFAQSSKTPVPSWLEVIRSSPYWISQGMYTNLVTLRSWVLNAQSYCEKPNRHILFDNRARFLGFIDDENSSEKTQNLLNLHRENLANTGRVNQWALGSLGEIGYPFALSCDQPEANLQTALDRYSGKIKEARLWGTWDGMRIGDANNTVSLHTALLQVYQDRTTRGRISLPEEILSTLAGKVLIESGGRARAHSTADARGIMQLSPAALQDCKLAEKFHFHRMAQVDCAFKLLEQNHRILEPVFTQFFTKLPAKKASELYSLLLIQAYHGGVGRVRDLMTEPELKVSARYLADHHERFSARDIALGMIYHNLGRNRLGLNSLYYVTDVGIAKEVACKAFADLPGC